MFTNTRQLKVSLIPGTPIWSVGNHSLINYFNLFKYFNTISKFAGVFKEDRSYKHYFINNFFILL